MDAILRSPQSAIKRTSVEEIRSLKLLTAIKTPYLPDGRFDLETYDELVNMQIEKGIEGVLVGGTTGEGHLMSLNERIMLIAHTVNTFGSSIKVIGNTGSNTTSEAIQATEQGFAVGMDAALQINPFYGITSIKGLISHFESVLSMGPVVIYNEPYRTGQDIPPQVIYTLARNPNFATIKECAGIDRIKEHAENGIVVWTGNDNLVYEARRGAGLSGLISVTANLVPGLIRQLMLGDMKPALNSKLTPLFEWLYIQPNPIALNTALAQLGVVKPVFRLPYVPLPKEKRVDFVNLVNDLGRENFVGQKDVKVLDDDDFIVVARY